MKTLKLILVSLALAGCAAPMKSVLAPINPENIVRKAMYVAGSGIVYEGIYVKTSNKEYFKALVHDSSGKDIFITFHIFNEDMRARVIISDKEIGAR